MNIEDLLLQLPKRYYTWYYLGYAQLLQFEAPKLDASPRTKVRMRSKLGPFNAGQACRGVLVRQGWL